MSMNSRIVLAFAAGAVAAAGIVYFAVKPSGSPHTTVAAVNASKPAPPAEVAQTASAVTTLPPIESASARPQKPSPAIARATPPPPADDDVPASVRRDDPEPPPTPPAPQQAQPPIAAPEPPPAPATAPTPEPAPEAPKPAPEPNHVTLRAGTVITVRLAEALSTDKNEKGDTFYATLDQPLVVDGFVIAEREARVEGRVVDAVRGGRGGAAAHLVLALTKIHTSDGQRVPIETAEIDQKGSPAGGENAAKVGGGAVLGAIIGAMAGGGKGAGIGAAAGGAAGAGGVLLTRGHAASLPSEYRLSFHLQQTVTVTERAH